MLLDARVLPLHGDVLAAQDVTTWMSTGPAPPPGAVIVHFVDVQLTPEGGKVDPFVTNENTVRPGMKFVPVIVTVLPPLVDPLDGLTLEIVGVAGVWLPGPKLKFANVLPPGVRMSMMYAPWERLGSLSVGVVRLH